MALSPSINPATYETMAVMRRRGHRCRDAANAAATAFRRTPWAHDAELRARVLDQMADAMERYRERLIAILSLENGKIGSEAALEADGSPASCATGRQWLVPRPGAPCSDGREASQLRSANP